MSRLQTQRAFNRQENMIKSGTIEAGPLASQDVPIPKSSLGDRVWGFLGDSITNFKLPTVKLPAFKTPGFLTAKSKPVATPMPTVTPTRSPTITPTPSIGTRVNINWQTPWREVPKVQAASGSGYLSPLPTGPSTPPKTWYTGGPEAPGNAERGIEPALWDTIMNRQEDETLKRLALALASQESSGGKALQGDWSDESKKYMSFGPYHIQPRWHPTLTEQQATDYKLATDYLFDWMKKRRAKGVSDSELVRQWNYNSGYQGDLKLRDKKGNLLKNSGPRYDVDIPQMATMSAFIKRK